MGMYTELNVGFAVKPKTEQAIFLKEYFANGELDKLPEHPFFKSCRWRSVLSSGGSYYFDGQPHSEFIYDEIAGEFFFTLRTNLKNYEGEIQSFMHWITPAIHSLEGNFLGYMRYEETEIPTLIYHPNNFVKITLIGNEGIA